MDSRELTVVEICAGAGGQSLGLEQAGFRHVLAVEIDSDAVATLRRNRPTWNVSEADIRDVQGFELPRIALLAGGVPCPPFSIAGKQLGAEDERDLFPEALRLVEEIGPEAVMLENVRGLASQRFDAYRGSIIDRLGELGFEADWRLLNSSDFGVPQLRPRFILVAMRLDAMRHFAWPEATGEVRTVGESLGDLVASGGWSGASEWAAAANRVGPTVVGGSKKHGGPDLGPTRARQAWLELGVDGGGIANDVPQADLPSNARPRLTNRMVARLQGFPDEWAFEGRKTSVYRQIGNAFPPPVARAVGGAIAAALDAAKVGGTRAHSRSEREEVA